MKLSEMRQILADRDIQLTKSLGQNFLHDANQLRRIVATAQLTRSDRVLEVGPGLGPLTELLLQEAGEVLAIEKDARLVAVLRERFNVGQASRLPQPETGETPVLRLVHDDALDYLRRDPRDWSDWKLVANLPYSAASTILVELALGARASSGAQTSPEARAREDARPPAQVERGPQRMTATLQIEVAKRLMARAGEEDYGVLTLLVQLDYEPQEWFRIPAGCFFPEPAVDSACVCLARRQKPLLLPESRDTFARVVKRSFSQRRKMMLKLLKQDWPEPSLAVAFERLHLSPRIRAEQVSLEQFARLAQTFCGEAEESGDAALMKEELFDVVNERDEVIGRQTRKEVHRLGLMHRAVHVLVFDSRGRVFLQKRSQKKDRQPSLWDSSASGHLESGEGYDACAVRELREEIGLRLSAPPRRLFKLAASEQTDHEHVWVYRCEAEGPFTLDPDEIERGDWFGPGEVTRWMGQRPEDFATALLLIWSRRRT
jgi:16S rRNA (adenine1518-N6/adenine1519-N6)-dimethyltransferase